MNKGVWDIVRAQFVTSAVKAEQYPSPQMIEAAFIGRSNVGKSSLVNAILGEDRMIVSDIAGTTRDATDSYVENEYGKFVFIDTAGLRWHA